MFMKKALSYLFLSISIVYTLSYFLRTNLDDPFYWYNSCLSPEGDVMECLALLLGKMWRVITGDNVFSFRLLGWIMGMCSICLPYFVLQSKEQAKNNIFYLAVGLLFMAGMTQGMYCPDSPTILLFVCIATFMLKRGYKGNNILILAVLSALCTACRFPNILCIPFFVVYLLIDGYFKKTLLHNIKISSVYLLLSLIGYYIIVAFIIGDIDVISSLKTSMTVVSQSNGASHGIKGLVMMYWWDFLSVFWGLSSFIGVFMVCRYFLASKKMSFRWALVAFIPVYLSIHHFDFSGKELAFLIIVIMMMWVKREKAISVKIQMLFVALLGFIACAGSNTGFFKIIPYYMAFSPIILIAFENEYKRDYQVKLLIAYFIVEAFISLFAKNIRQWHSDKSMDYYVSAVDYNNRSVFNHYTGLFVDEEFDVLQGMMSDYKKYGVKDHTIFYGRPECHKMYALTNTEMFYHVPFYMEPDSEFDTDNALKYVLNDKHMVMFDYTCSELIREKMKENNYRAIKSGNGVVIYKCDK